MRQTLLAAGAVLLFAAAPAMSEIKIGYLADLSGATSVLTGESGLRAVEMAIADAGGMINGEEIDLLTADHLGKPDVGLGVAREWLDTESVNLILNADHSAVALAISELIADKDVIFLANAVSSRMTNESCKPNQLAMLMDSYGLARGITKPLVEAGRDSWFFIEVDYAFGHDLGSTGAAAVEEAGGNVVGSVRHSPQTTDFSSFLLEAQSRGAQTIGLATFGSYQIAIAKQAQEFGLDIPLAPFFLGITDIKAAGLENAQNISGAIQFYWDYNDETRAFAKRFQEVYDRPPTFTNAMLYEFTRHYLKAIATVGSTDASDVRAWMGENPVALIDGSTATIREDGRVLRPMYAYTTKTPDESTGDWDYLTISGSLEPELTALPLDQSKCALVQ